MIVRGDLNIRGWLALISLIIVLIATWGGALILGVASCP